jgi:hypothetical protein
MTTLHSRYLHIAASTLFLLCVALPSRACIPCIDVWPHCTHATFILRLPRCSFCAELSLGGRVSNVLIYAHASLTLLSYFGVHAMFLSCVALPSRSRIPLMLAVHVALETETSGRVMYQCNRMLKYNIRIHGFYSDVSFSKITKRLSMFLVIIRNKNEWMSEWMNEWMNK